MTNLSALKFLCAEASQQQQSTVCRWESVESLGNWNGINKIQTACNKRVSDRSRELMKKEGIYFGAENVCWPQGTFRDQTKSSLLFVQSLFRACQPAGLSSLKLHASTTFKDSVPRRASIYQHAAWAARRRSRVTLIINRLETLRPTTPSGIGKREPPLPPNAPPSLCVFCAPRTSLHRIWYCRAKQCACIRKAFHFYRGATSERRPAGFLCSIYVM